MNKIIKLFKESQQLPSKIKRISFIGSLVVLFSTILITYLLLANFLHFLNDETELTWFKFIYDFSIELFDFEFTVEVF